MKLPILLALILTCQLQAQPLRLKVINQYEKKCDNVTLLINGVTQVLTVVNDSITLPNIAGVDSIQLGAKYCAFKTFKLNTIDTTKPVVLNKSFTWHDLINPMFYIIYGGLWLLLFIIFAETGLFAGFFLPGDSLLFVAGIYSDKLAHEFLKLIGLGTVNNQWLDLLVLILLISVAGIVGNFVGYWFGRKVGPAMFSWKDNLLFKKKYLYQAQEFYDNNGGGAIIAARFLPIVRTFAPIVAGIVGMNKVKFTFFNIIGCLAWVSSMLLIGHFLDKAFPTLKEHLELIIIGIVLITTAPVVIKMISKKKPKTSAN